jgi:putative SOS response-associated peptidase YedK
MKNGSPFGLAGLWDNWKDPANGEWMRTFVIITVPANALVASIHNRMPAILKPSDYVRWLSAEPDPAGLLEPFASELMMMWPVSRRVNSPRDDDPGLIERMPAGAAA